MRTPGGSVDAQAVVVACDGLVPRLLPQLAAVVYPVRGQMAATAPLPPDLRVLECPVHSQFGFMYYRPTSDGRIAIGGGRLEHLEAEYTDVESTSEGVQRTLDRFAVEQLGLDGVEVTHRWAGIMGFSADLLPLAGEVPGAPGLYVSGGYSGVGNVQGHRCGRLVADLIATGEADGVAAFSPERFGDESPEQIEKTHSRRLVSSLGLG